MDTRRIEAELLRGLTETLGPAAACGWTLEPPPIPTYVLGVPDAGHTPLAWARHVGWACPMGGSHPGLAEATRGGDGLPRFCARSTTNHAPMAAAVSRARTLRGADDEVRLLMGPPGCLAAWISGPGGDRLFPWLSNGRPVIPGPVEGIPREWMGW